MSAPNLVLRPATDGDREFLYRVYAAARAGEMALVNHWSAAEKDAFLRFQFEAQDRHYHRHYPSARYEIIVRDGEDAGRLYVARLGGEIRLMDIALLPEHRSRGSGGTLVRALLDEAAREGQRVSLHVEADNPARRLYRRLGFVAVEEVGVYQLMHWEPAAQVNTAS